jgi:hypothetical protein
LSFRTILIVILSSRALRETANGHSWPVRIPWGRTRSVPVEGYGQSVPGSAGCPTIRSGLIDLWDIAVDVGGRRFRQLADHAFQMALKTA